MNGKQLEQVNRVMSDVDFASELPVRIRAYMHNGGRGCTRDTRRITQADVSIWLVN